MQNALAGLGSLAAKYDLVGPTVDDDIRRIVARYGASAVKDALSRQTKAKRGRKPEKDWPEIDKVLKEDARLFLQGGDPFASRSNYSIAQTYAAAHPGHSHAATQRRIMKKLAEKRVMFTLINAEIIGRDCYPHGGYLRTLRALIAALPTWDAWRSILSRAESSLADYAQKLGPVPESMTMKEVEEGAMKALIVPLTPNGRSLAGIIDSLLAKQL